MKLNRLTRSLIAACSLVAAVAGAQAAVVDLTTQFSSGTIGGATYTQVSPQPTGTGYIDSFVEIGDASPNTGLQVHAYNTTVNTVLDNGSSDQFNRAIQVATQGFVDLGGGNIVMRFLLDINQTGSSPLLNLDDVQIFISTVANQSVSVNLGDLLPLSNSFLVYRMDAGTDNTVTLDYGLNSGSGSGDMTLDIPRAALLAAFTAGGLLFDTVAEQNAAFIYLYSSFGSPDNVNNDGFEEWAQFQGTGITDEPCIPTQANNFCGQQQIPEPASLPLVAAGLLGAWWAIRRRSV